ncbi:MAG: PspC domain-containing protein [Desulfobacteraceae bacterium]
MRHFQKNGRHRKFYRGKGSYRGFGLSPGRAASVTNIYRSRQGIIFGVCRGLADHFNISVFWLRTIVVCLFFFTGFWPVGVLYLAAAMLLKPDPVAPLETRTGHESFENFTASRESTIQKIKSKLENIDRRIQKMEDTVTSRDFEF